MKKLLISGAAIALLGAMTLPVFAETTATTTNGTTGGTNTTVPKKEVKREVNLACVQAAVDKRETAIQGAFSTLSASVTRALTTRATALHAAWGLTVKADVKKGVNAAWSAYRSSLR